MFPTRGKCQLMSPVDQLIGGECDSIGNIIIVDAVLVLESRVECYDKGHGGTSRILFSFRRVL